MKVKKKKSTHNLTLLIIQLEEFWHVNRLKKID